MQDQGGFGLTYHDLHCLYLKYVKTYGPFGACDDLCNILFFFEYLLAPAMDARYKPCDACHAGGITFRQRYFLDAGAPYIPINRHNFLLMLE